MKLQAFDSSCFRGKHHFEGDDTQNYLVFQPVYRYFKKIGNAEHISSWKSKELSDEVIKSPNTPGNSLAPALSYIGNKIRVKSDRSCLKPDKVTFTHGKIVNIYIVSEISVSDSSNNYPTLENCLFGAIKLTKNADIDKCKYFVYGIGFDRRGTSSFPSGQFGCYVRIFRIDLSSSVHVDNKKKYISILGEGPTQGLDGASLTVEKSIRLILL